MIKIGNTIIEDDLKIEARTKTRETARAILINDQNQVGLLYSKLYLDYTFPGGGIKDGESHLSALQRELREEIGALDLSDIKPFGYTEELKYGLFTKDKTYIQKSYYYICDVLAFDAPNLQGRENDQGLSLVYVDVDVALENNKIAMLDENHQKLGIKTALKREALILEKIKELINEKI